jgi:hypothetical protein
MVETKKGLVASLLLKNAKAAIKISGPEPLPK